MKFNVLSQFQVFNADAKRLLKANAIFGFLIYFIIIFSNAFIFANVDGDITFNLLYSALHFVGNPLGFIVNGFLSRRFHIKSLFVFGMSIFIINMTVMMFLPGEFFTEMAVLTFGLISGIGSGMYWSARTYLTVVSTTDDNRTFFSSLDFVFIIAGGIITPFVVGTLVLGVLVEADVLTKAMAYQLCSLVAVGLVVLAAYLVLRGNYAPVRIKRFIYFRYDRAWRKTRWFVFIMGLYHGVYLSLPAIFILKFVAEGKESTLGVVDSITHLVALITIYVTGRFAKASQRPYIILAGCLVFFGGAAFFGGLMSSAAMIGTIILVASFYFADPMMNFPYRALFMKSIDHLRSIEGRSEFTYVVDIENFNALGRVVSVVAFYLLVQAVDIIIAAPIIILAVATLQFLHFPISKKINSEKSAPQPAVMESSSLT